MTTVKIDTIGTGVSNTYKTIAEWWSAITSINSGNLVTNDRIQIGQLSAGNHHLAEKLTMYSGDVTTDSSRYVILKAEDRAAFSGIIPVLTNTQDSLTFVTGNLPEWFDCTVPYTRFQNFAIKSLGIDTSNSSNYIFNIGNSGLIDGIGLHCVPFRITSLTNGSDFSLNLVKLYGNSEIRNSVLLHPNLTVSGSMTSCMVGMSAIKYRDGSSVNNNTIINGSGNLYLTSAAARDSTKLRLYGIKEDFCPCQDIEDCFLWYDFDDSTTLFTTNTAVTYATTSGNTLGFIYNKVEKLQGTDRFDSLFFAYQSLSNRRPIYRPNYVNGRSVGYGLRSSTQTVNNGSGWIVDAVFNEPTANSGYSLFVVCSISGEQNSVVDRTLCGNLASNRQICDIHTSGILYNYLSIYNSDLSDAEFTTVVMDNLPLVVNPFKVYSCVIDPVTDLTVSVYPTPYVVGHSDVSSSGTNLGAYYWEENLTAIRDNANNTVLGLNGRRAGTNLYNCPTTAFGEFLLYDRPLTSGEVYQVQKYLIDKWTPNTYARSPDAFLGLVNTSTGNVYNNYVEFNKGNSSNGNSFIVKNYDVIHDNYSYNAGQDLTASGLFPNNVHYTGIAASVNFTTVDSSGNVNARILPTAYLQAKGTPLSFSYDIDGLPRYYWDIGADELITPTSGYLTCSLFGHLPYSGDITLFTHGALPDSGLISLFENGHLPDSGSSTLFTRGHLESSGSIPCFVWGHLPDSGSSILYINGHLVSTGNSTLYTQGHLPDSGSPPLFVWGHLPDSGARTLYVGGHLENSGNITLYAQGHLASSGSPPLFIWGHLSSSGIPTLYINGHENNSGSTPLFVWGRLDDSANIPLYINGHEVNSNDLDLYINGHLNLSNNCDLYLLGHENNLNNCPLYINGHQDQNNNLNLFLQGHETIASGANLVIGGYFNQSSGLELYLGGAAPENNNCNLNIYGYNTDSNNIPLSISSLSENAAQCNLFIHGNSGINNSATLYLQGAIGASGQPPLNIIGAAPSNSPIDLYLCGHLTNSGITPLYIAAHDTSSAQSPLSVIGHSPDNNQIPLYLTSYNTLSSGINLNISGLDINSVNNSTLLSILGYSNIEDNVDFTITGKEIANSQTPLYLPGYGAANSGIELFIGEVSVVNSSSSLWMYGKDSSSSNATLVIIGPAVVITDHNVRTCVFDFNIPDTLLQLHEQVSTDMLISANIGVDVGLYYPPRRSDCPNCEYNSFAKKSANIYTAGGPIPFTNGTLCPYCNGNGFIYSEEEDTVKMKIYWTPKDWIDIGFDVQQADGIIQTQALVSDLPKIQKCNYMIPNLRTYSSVQYKYKLIKESVPHGFRQDKFFISYWQQIQ